MIKAVPVVVSLLFIIGCAARATSPAAAPSSAEEAMLDDLQHRTFRVLPHRVPQAVFRIGRFPEPDTGGSLETAR